MPQQLSSKRRLYRVELHLLTHLWNEGFEKAQEPWLQLYTDNTDWAESLPGEYTIPGRDGWDQDLRVRVDRLDPESELPTQEELDDEDWDLEDAEEGESSSRYIALTPGLSDEELDEIVDRRLSEWDGI